MSAQRLARCRAVLNRRQPDLSVILDHVHKPHNLSAIIRTCDAVGAYGVHAVQKGRSVSVHQHYASGAGEWVDLTAYSDVEAAIAAQQAQGVAVYAAHLSSSAVDFRAVDYIRPCSILLGAELWGVSEAAAAAVDQHIIIPMAGFVESLNVSVAAAVILFEAQRQRSAAGLYDAPRISAQEYERILFEWLHPRLAKHLNDRGAPYPALDEDGDPILSSNTLSTPSTGRS